MRFFKSTLFATTLLSTSVISAQADVNVVASIKPIHSLVAAVMEGVGEPELIIEGAGSPHTYALKPSQARVLQNADVVFWFGHELEAFLEKPLEAIAKDAKSVELLDAHDLIKLEFREGGAFEKHGHDDEDGHDDHDDEDGHDDHDNHDKDHDDHDEHADEKKHDEHDHDEHADEEKHDEHDHDEHADKEKHDEHDHDEHANEKKHDDHDGHDEHEEIAGGHDEHGGSDPHVWLDPLNAKALVHEIEETLVEADPDNAAKYEANAEALMSKIDGLVAEVSAEMEPLKDKGFVVFHDAYQYYETRFDLSAVGSVTVSPEVLPGAERIRELQEKIKELNAVCIFSEPQFESKLVTTLTDGTSLKSSVIDPLGSGIEDGPELYFTLIRNMATSFKTCLSES